MKNPRLSVFLFVLTFVAVYLCLCYLVPEMAVKPIVATFSHFWASIRYRAFFKSTFSLFIGVIVGSVPTVIGKPD